LPLCSRVVDYVYEMFVNEFWLKKYFPARFLIRSALSEMSMPFLRPRAQ
jgi:hypothetical protein